MIPRGRPAGQWWSWHHSPHLPTALGPITYPVVFLLRPWCGPKTCYEFGEREKDPASSGGPALDSPLLILPHESPQIKAGPWENLTLGLYSGFQTQIYGHSSMRHFSSCLFLCKTTYFSVFLSFGEDVLPEFSSFLSSSPFGHKRTLRNLFKGRPYLGKIENLLHLFSCNQDKRRQKEEGTCFAWLTMILSQM